MPNPLASQPAGGRHQTEPQESPHAKQLPSGS
jgi:hypothetical protein